MIQLKQLTNNKMIMKFKGTKSKWHKQQNKQGDIEIYAIGFENLATVNLYPKGFREKYINGKLTGSPAPDSSQFRTECVYNAKIIVKAPEMLEKHVEEIEILESVLKQLDELGGFMACDLKELIKSKKKLIKEATEI